MKSFITWGPVFGIYNQIKRKSPSSATETSQITETLHIARHAIKFIPSREGICFVLYKPENQVFSRKDQNVNKKLPYQYRPRPACVKNSLIRSYAACD